MLPLSTRPLQVCHHSLNERLLFGCVNLVPGQFSRLGMRLLNGFFQQLPANAVAFAFELTTRVSYDALCVLEGCSSLVFNELRRLRFADGNHTNRIHFRLFDGLLRLSDGQLCPLTV